jgi:hypothetical protein
VLELLEKRVRSRCGNVVPIHFLHPTPHAAAQALRATLTLPEGLPHATPPRAAAAPGGLPGGAATPGGRAGSVAGSVAGSGGGGKRRWETSPVAAAPDLDLDAGAATAAAAAADDDDDRSPVARRLSAWQAAWNQSWERVSASKEWEGVVRRHVGLGRSPAALVALAACALDGIAAAPRPTQGGETAAENSGSGSSGGGSGRRAAVALAGLSLPGAAAWAEAAQRMAPAPPLERVLAGLGAAESALLLR